MQRLRLKLKADGRIVELRDGGRAIVVADAQGELCEFTLRRATAAFVARGKQHSPRLEF